MVLVSENLYDDKEFINLAEELDEIWSDQCKIHPVTDRSGRFFDKLKLL